LASEEYYIRKNYARNIFTFVNKKDKKNLPTGCGQKNAPG